MVVESLDHLVLTVRDVEATVAWYTRALGMRRRETPRAGAAPRIALEFGDQKINVRPLDADRVEWTTAVHPATGSADLCFLTTTAPDGVIAHLRTCGIGIEAGPVDRHGARGTLRSVYCRDPDGSLVEISSYR